MKTKPLLAVLFIVGICLFGCRPTTIKEIANFEQCAAAGYPVMESYPRQCRTPDGRTFVEVVPPIQPEEVKLSYAVGGCGVQESREYVKTRGLMEARVDFKIVDGFIELIHHLNYVCCAEMKVYLDSIETLPERTVVKIREKNEGEMCRCVCDYDIAAKVGPFEEGKYLVQIWGVEFEQMPVELLWEKEIEVKAPNAMPGLIGLPNPASTYCIEHGGDLKIVKDEHGNEYGICVFPDGSECEEWAFYRGECRPKAIPGEGFCGWSTNGSCTKDEECIIGGCSGQVCQSVFEEPVITTCEFKQCYDAALFGVSCKCINGQCRWR